LEASDQGYYLCLASNKIEQDVRAYTYVTVESQELNRIEDKTNAETKEKETGPVVKIKEGDKFTKKEGESIRLTCEATGNPEPAIKWEKYQNDSLPSRHSIQNNVLT